MGAERTRKEDAEMTAKEHVATIDTLDRLGFHVERHAGGSEHVAPWYAKNEVRVVIDEQVEVFVFTDKRRTILAWKCTFDLATPAEVVASALLKIVGG